MQIQKIYRFTNRPQNSYDSSRWQLFLDNQTISRAKMRRTVSCLTRILTEIYCRRCSWQI